MLASIFHGLNLVQSNDNVLPIIIIHSEPLLGGNAAVEFFVNMRGLCLYRVSYGLVMGMWRPPHSCTDTAWEKVYEEQRYKIKKKMYSNIRKNKHQLIII